MTRSFDEASDAYAELVQSSISFAGQEHDFFVRRKAEVLAALVGRHLPGDGRWTGVDVGCGIGAIEHHLTGVFAHLIGVEPSGPSVERAAAALPELEFRVGDGTALPLDDAVADVTFTVNVLHHVDPGARDRVVAEMARVTRPGGLVVAFEHNPLNPLTRLSVARCEFDDGVELLRPREIRRRFTRAGLDPVDRRYILFTPFDVAWQHRVEAKLGWLPFGAQHLLAARRP